MNINFTLVVQVIHFFIAYKLIERLLLRPVAALIQQEDKEHLKLQNLVAFGKERLEQKELDKQKEWRMLQQLFVKARPRAVSLGSEQTTQVMISPDKPDEREVQEAIAKSTDFLVAKVGHD